MCVCVCDVYTCIYVCTHMYVHVYVPADLIRRGHRWTHGKDFPGQRCSEVTLWVQEAREGLNQLGLSSVPKDKMEKVLFVSFCIILYLCVVFASAAAIINISMILKSVVCAARGGAGASKAVSLLTLQERASFPSRAQWRRVLLLQEQRINGLVVQGEFLGKHGFYRLPLMVGGSCTFVPNIQFRERTKKVLQWGRTTHRWGSHQRPSMWCIGRAEGSLWFQPAPMGLRDASRSGLCRAENYESCPEGARDG